MVADLDDFDYTDLTTMEPDQLAIFILATYGEGEPTDNATAFDIFLKFQEAQACEAGRKPLCSLCYAAFGLGSSSYQFFNGMITKVDGAMQKCGATRIGSVGLGDDGTGTLESDFIAWRDATLSEIATHFTLEAKPYKYVRAFTVEETSDTTDMSDVFLGEPNKAHLNRKIRGPFTARNPYPAAIVEAKELFKSSDRNCLHLELDISGSTITYETGDHVALWPVNSDLEVERFLSVFGLSDKRDRVIEVISNDPTRKSPIPSRTTYETVARYYLEVCAPVSQATVAILATLVSGPSREFLQKLGSDFTLFQNQVSNKSLNLPQLLETVADDKSYSSIPFSFLLENMGRLQPRYYSISSSSLVSRKTISITAVVESSTAVGSNIAFKGVCTNYLLAAKNNLVAPPRDEKITTGIQTHQFQGPRNIYTHPTALIHVRRSKFRLPRDPKTPVVMIGPGTGIAPFRGFVQERALLASNGREIGPTLLFYGCRRREDDFLYEEEWQVYSSSVPAGKFCMYTAFSRENPSRKATFRTWSALTETSSESSS
jgi:NADPH-ferrihemoprotein reductase